MASKRQDERTYVIKDGAITCLKCGLTSHNINDLRYGYCGNCHKFHEHYEPVKPEVYKERKAQ